MQNLFPIMLKSFLEEKLIDVSNLSILTTSFLQCFNIDRNAIVFTNYLLVFILNEVFFKEKNYRANYELKKPRHIQQTISSSTKWRASVERR